MTLSFRVNGAPLPLELTHLIVAGWTGRDADAIAHHIAELAELGVPAPSDTPLYYRVSAPLLSCSNRLPSRFCAAAMQRSKAALISSAKAV